MPYIDVAVTGQVTNGTLRYTFVNPVANTEAIDVLGYSIKRSHSNVHEGNCYLDFKVGSTAISSLRVPQAGVGYDPDNPPRHDNTSSDSPSLGVEFSLAGDIESRGQGISLPDYVEMINGRTVLVRSPISPEFGALTLHVHVSAPYDYAYRVWYLMSASVAAPAVVTDIDLSVAAWRPVHVAARSSWFEYSADKWRDAFMRAHNAASTRVFGATAPQLEYFEGAFSLSSSVGFRALELDRLSYVLCGMSTTRHAVHTYAAHAVLTSVGKMATRMYSLGSSGDALGARLAIRPANAGLESASHDERYAGIQQSLASSQRMLVDASCGEMYTARLRPGQYPIGSVLHAPYPVVLDVEEANAVDETDGAQIPPAGVRRTAWEQQQSSFGARPTKSLGISRRQAADGLIKEVQDAMNYAVHGAGLRGRGTADAHSLPSMMPQYTSDANELPAVPPFVYDPSVPHFDNPARYADAAQAYKYEYDVGHQSADALVRRQQSVYVTLEDAGGGPDASGRGAEFASGDPSLETAGWNGYRCSRVRITTGEARNGDTRQGASGIETIRTDAESARGGAIKQNISLLFGSGPNRERSIHRALGFEDRDYVAPSRFVMRKPRVATLRTESAGELAETVPANDGSGRAVHVVNRPGRDVAGQALRNTSGLIEGHVYTFDGRVYTRYVPVLSTPDSDAAPYDVDFHYKGGVSHFAYYTIHGFQAPHSYNLDTDPMLVSMGLAVNERTHTEGDCVAGSTSAFALLPIGHADHAEPRTYRDGSVYQHAMLQYRLSGYTTAPHAVGVDRLLAGFRNFGRVAPNTQDAYSRRWGALATDATALASRDTPPTARCVHMLKAGDFGVKRMRLDEATRVGGVTLTFAVPAKTPYPYNFGAQEIIILLRLHRRADRDPREDGRASTRT